MIYKFVIISGEEESFIREFELDENNTLLDFHNAIQEELEYDKSHLASFFTTTSKWEKEEEFTLFDMGSNTTLMEDVIIDDIIINVNQKLLYIFDLFNERALFIECVGEVELIVGREYPICTQSQGKPPQQVYINGFSDTVLSDDDLSDTGITIDDDMDMPDLDSLEDFDDL
ncbi:MAG: hypothetical protein V2I37_00510 [Marinilabiliaceae bacterium]|jgi:hypothetical protein|nr:hypothetical protein [Marinilabiliaceae bacterium]